MGRVSKWVAAAVVVLIVAAGLIMYYPAQMIQESVPSTVVDAVDKDEDEHENVAVSTTIGQPPRTEDHRRVLDLSGGVRHSDGDGHTDSRMEITVYTIDDERVTIAVAYRPDGSTVAAATCAELIDRVDDAGDCAERVTGGRRPGELIGEGTINSEGLIELPPSDDDEVWVKVRRYHADMHSVSCDANLIVDMSTHGRSVAVPGDCA